MRKRGYAETTTNAIAQEAGVSIGSLYQYFPNKESLTAEVFRRLIEKDLGFIEDGFARCADLPLRDAWRTIISAVFTRYESDVALRRVLIEQCSRVGGNDSFAGFKTALASLFLREFRRREMPLPEASAKPVAFVVTHALEGILRGSVLEGRPTLERALILRETEGLFLAYINHHCQAGTGDGGENEAAKVSTIGDQRH